MDLEQLQSARRAMAEEAFAQYEFGEGVTVEASSGWEYYSRSDDWVRSVFVKVDDAAEDAPTTKLVLTVLFEPDRAEIRDAWASGPGSAAWGALPRRAWDVHLVEAVRLKIGGVEALTPSGAMQRASLAKLGAFVDRALDIPMPDLGDNAALELQAHHEGLPLGARVDLRGENGAVAEHQFDFDNERGWEARQQNADQPLAPTPTAVQAEPGPAVPACRTYLGELRIVQGESHIQSHVLVVATGAASAEAELARSAENYFGEPDDEESEDVEVGVRAKQSGFYAVPVKLTPIPVAVYQLLRSEMVTYVEDGAAEPVALQGSPDLQGVVAAVPQLQAVISSALGALDALATQVGQMRGMFDDEDGTIQAAVDAGEEAETLLRAARAELDAVRREHVAQNSGTAVEAEPQAAEEADAGDAELSHERPRG